jgi:cytochrome c-type biogenesis protein
VNLSLSFSRGLLASVNPCGFVLLPTYLMYFLGVSATDKESERAPIGRSLLVGTTVSAGFIAVFLVIGLVTQHWTHVLFQNAKYATAIIGVAFIVLGIALLLGLKLPFVTPTVQPTKHDRTLRSMFVYGVAYATASLGCTLPLFTLTLFSTGNDGYWAGVANVVVYSIGMALVVLSLTIALATANLSFVRWLRSKMMYVEMVSGAFVLLSGMYMLWYFWQVDVQEAGDPITDAVDRLQRDAQTWLVDNWQVAAWLLGGVVALAVGYALTRERRRPLAE